jgi:hypothetical protein
MSNGRFYQAVLIVLLGAIAWLGIRLEVIKSQAKDQADSLKKSRAALLAPRMNGV